MSRYDKSPLRLQIEEMSAGDYFEFDESEYSGVMSALRNIRRAKQSWFAYSVSITQRDENNQPVLWMVQNAGSKRAMQEHRMASEKEARQRRIERGLPAVKPRDPNKYLAPRAPRRR